MRQKTSDLRQLYASVILNVRKGKARSRTDLAQALGISASTVGLYSDQLIATGHLNETGLDQGSMGRPKRMLSVEKSPGWFAGIEFNASRLFITGVDFSGDILTGESLPLAPEATAAEVERLILTTLRSWAQRIPLPLLGVGVGAPGLVDSARGISLRYDFIRGWKEVPLQDILAREFNVPVQVENNLRAIALAERWFGSHRHETNYVVVGPRNGFAIASVQDGELLHGANHALGEIGLWPWPLSGGSGSRELHHELSAPMTYRRLAGLPVQAPVPEDLHTALLSLVHDSSTQWQEVAQDYARVLACIQLVLDPRICLLHGPLTALGTRFCQEVMAAAVQIAPALKDIPLQLECSQLGDNAGALGAASLAMEAWQPEHV